MILDIKRTAKMYGKTLKEVADNIQAEGSDKVGISVSALSQHIKGNPSVKVLQSIASAIGCKVTELFYDEEGVSSSLHVRCPHCGKTLNIHID